MTQKDINPHLRHSSLNSQKLIRGIPQQTFFVVAFFTVGPAVMLFTALGWVGAIVGALIIFAVFKPLIALHEKDTKAMPLLFDSAFNTPYRTALFTEKKSLHVVKKGKK